MEYQKLEKAKLYWNDPILLELNKFWAGLPPFNGQPNIY
jgi:hypothetical protein